MPDFINEIQAENKNLSIIQNVSELTDKEKARYELLKGFIIDQSKEYIAPEALLYYDEHPLFYRGEISVFAGKSKCRKSFLACLIISCLLGAENSKFHTKNKKTYKVLYFDTEQSEYRVMLFKKRVNTLCNINTNNRINNIEYVSLLSTDEKVNDINVIITDVEILIKAIKPDFVFLDNIGDFCTDNNDEKESKILVKNLQNFSKNNNCHISVVLHLSESTSEFKALGALGRVLMEKGATQINLEKNGDSNSISTKVIFSRTRDLSPEPFYFNIKKLESGISIPYITEEGTNDTRDQKTKNLDKIIENLDIWFKNGATIKSGDLNEKIQTVLGLKKSQANDIIADLKKQNLIRNSEKYGYFEKPSANEIFAGIDGDD